ncbi:tail fiber domain-containing protein [Tunicatimonas pelagia]|uniref:tail fiber domain-containing protein n=1 Tax=Tunicatimonas pelagia TaxID=931531 RepID=UPI0026651181|nr:tail fiber domain-containing protein [Tunicatimonas pelagia]WKN43204.1 tail fiber domain-containing protein [Tunicatimonas pelagia]
MAGQHQINEKTIIAIVYYLTAQAQLTTPEVIVQATDGDRTEVGDYLQINGSGTSGSTILQLNTARAWSFIQEGSGTSAYLTLKSSSGNKHFQIAGPADKKVARFKAATDGNDSRVFLASDGGTVTLGVDTEQSQHKLYVAGTACKTQGGGSWAVCSDRKLKRNIQPFSYGLETITQVNPVSFEYNGLANTQEGERNVGVIAQELQQIAPFMVNTVKQEGMDDYLTVDPSAFDFMLINAIQEQQNMLKEQQQLIQQLQQQVKQLSTQQANQPHTACAQE